MWLWVSIKFIINRYWKQINATNFDVNLNVMAEDYPVIISGNWILGFMNSEMTSKMIVAIITDQFRVNNF